MHTGAGPLTLLHPLLAATSPRRWVATVVGLALLAAGADLLASALAPDAPRGAREALAWLAAVTAWSAYETRRAGRLPWPQWRRAALGLWVAGLAALAAHLTLAVRLRDTRGLPLGLTAEAVDEAAAMTLFLSIAVAWERRSATAGLVTAVVFGPVVLAMHSVLAALR